MNFRNILIYGLGLMGGSLAMALKEKDKSLVTTGIVRSERSLFEAMELNLADRLYTEEDFLKKDLWNSYDLIVYSLPVDSTCQKINELPDSYNGFITDLGSTKKEIVDTVERKFKKGHRYCSSHPMTGSENSGPRFSKADLYQNKLCILTKPEKSCAESLDHMQKFWTDLGSKTVHIPAEEHDEILAYLSHSPHILSSLLVTWASERKEVENYTNKSPLALAGGGFKDMSRIAGSNPEMWEAIIQTNRKSILNSLTDFKGKLDRLIQTLSQPDSSGYWKEYFEKAKEHRHKILKL